MSDENKEKNKQTPPDKGNRSRNAVKVQSDYSVVEHDSKRSDGFSERSEAYKSLGYTHWFDLQGDREAAQRLAAQKSLSVRDLFHKSDDDETYSPDDIAHSGDREHGEEDSSAGGSSGEEGYDGEGYDDESPTNMEGSGIIQEKDGWLRSPYGSLIRGENRSRTGLRDDIQISLKGTVKGTKSRGSLAKLKRAKKKRRRLILSAIAILLVICILVGYLIIQVFLGAIGGIINFKQSGHWGRGVCTCGCLEQFYSGGQQGGLIEIGDGVISGSLENGGIVTFNVPRNIQRREKPDGSVETKTLYTRKNWAVYEFGNSHLDTHPPYDSEGLPYVVVAIKLLDPTTPDDSHLHKPAVVGNNPVYARLLLKEESGELNAVIVRINTNDGKAHTFNRYPGESTRYTPEKFRATQMRITAGGKDLRPYVDEKVTYNIPSGIIQTGIAYPNSANAGGYIKYDGPWMPMNADGSTIEFHQIRFIGFQGGHPNAELYKFR